METTNYLFIIITIPSENSTSHDPVIAEIEKFMIECQNMIPPSRLKINKGKIYDTENLLDILKDNETKVKINSSKPNQTRDKLKVLAVAPKKRQFNEKNDIIPKKQLKQDEKIPRPRGRPKSIFFRAAIKTLGEIKFTCCKNFFVEKKRRKAVRVTVGNKTANKAVVQVVQTCCDSVTVRNIVVKKEIIDLTDDDCSFYMNIHFPVTVKINHNDCCSPFLQKAQVTEVPNHLNEAVLSQPDVRFDLNETTVIDLTGCDDDTDSTIRVTSEKECANNIIQFIYKFYRIEQVNKKVENVLDEIRECLPQEEGSNCLTIGIISKTVTSIGYNLVQKLSTMYIKNINMWRFLEILSTKLEHKHQLTLPPQTVGLYLQTLLNQNRQHCKGLAGEFLKKINEIVDLSKFKKEVNFDDTPLFTSQQLEQLKTQIEQYHDIVRRQEVLMRTAFDLRNSNENDDLSSGNCQSDLVSKQIKSEILDKQTESTSTSKVKNEIP